MTIRIVVLFVLSLLAASNVFADDVTIDSSGNVRTGVSNSNAELEVTGGSAEGAIRGMTSGTGASGVYGVNTSFGDYGILGYYGIGVYGYSSAGDAGYFQGNAHVTGNLTVDGSITGTLSETDPQVGTLTSGKWCTSDGTAVNCTSDASISETDPQVGSNTTNYVPKWNGSALVTGSMYDNGNIGIGTTYPMEKLEVVGAILSSGTGPSPSIRLQNTSAAEWRITSYDDSKLLFWNGSDRMAIDQSGNVGINTATPSSRLTVAGTIESTSGGIKFPDSTVQSTASAPSWHQILAASERFVLVMNNNEAVLDRETGLVWEKSPSTGTYPWVNAAFSYCANLDVGGRMGWHLPTAEQLTSLIDNSEFEPSLPSGHPFTNVHPTVTAEYWSATTDSTSTAVTVTFGDLLVNHVNSDTKTNYNYVWCVRGGQSQDAY